MWRLYGYPPMMTQQQHPPQQEPLDTIRRPPGDHTPGAQAPHEYTHQEPRAKDLVFI